MKRHFFSFGLIFSLFFLPCTAEETPPSDCCDPCEDCCDPCEECCEPPPCCEPEPLCPPCCTCPCNKCSSPRGFFTITSDALFLTNADFDVPGFTDQHLAFYKVDTTLSYAYIANTCTIANVGIGYGNVRVDWAENPYFNESHFETATFFLQGSTKCIPCWDWSWIAAGLFDVDHFLNNEFFSFYAQLHGRYAYNRCLGMHFGFMTGLGYHDETVYPVIGFDYLISPCWQINLIFPVDFSLVYSISPCWTAGASLRQTGFRHRADIHNPTPEAIFEYSNMGLELTTEWTPHRCLSLSLFAGWMKGGDLEVYDQKGNELINLEFDGSAYVGGDARVSF